MSETDEFEARIAELEAERDALQRDVLGLHRDTDELFKETEDHAFAVAMLNKRIAELEAERDALSWAVRAHERNLLEHSDAVNELGAENAALRKALEDAPHDFLRCSSRGSSSAEYRCDCWKSRIPQPTHQTLEQSLPDGKRADKP